MPQNPRVGDEETRELRFERWVWLSEKARIGLTSDGEVFGFVSHHEKNLAYLLSGRRKIQEIFLSSDERLWAIDRQGNVLEFSDQKWLARPLRTVLKNVASGLADELAIFAGLYILGKEQLGNNWDLATLPTLILGGMAATSLAFMQVWKAAVMYGDLNRFPDAFQPTGKHFDLNGGEVARRFQDFIRDLAPLAKNLKLYDRTCELELLPDSVDHTTWKP